MAMDRIVETASTVHTGQAEPTLVVSLHVGPWKTGTTSLQSTLAGARAALREAGYHYPTGMFDPRAHHEIPNWVVGSLPRFMVGYSPLAPTDLGLNGYLQSLMDEARGVHAHTLVLSSEDFCFLDEAGWGRFFQQLRQWGASAIRVTWSHFDPEERLPCYVSQYVSSGAYVTAEGAAAIRDWITGLMLSLPRMWGELSDEWGVDVRSLAYANDEHYLTDVVSAVTDARVARRVVPSTPELLNPSLGQDDLARLNAFNRVNVEGRALELSTPVMFSHVYPYARERLLMMLQVLDERNRAANELTRIKSSRTWRTFGWWRSLRG